MVVVGLRAVCLVALLLVLPGCSSQGASPTATSASVTFDDVHLEAHSGKGLIRGIVTDSAVRPVAGANVSLREPNQHVLTDAQGRFGFSEVEPGVHFLTASKVGFTTVQTSVEVAADRKDPPLAQLRLEAVPGSQPYFTPLKWDGFMQCSFIVAGAFGTGCLLTVAVPTGDSSRFFSPIDRTPSFLQNELRWTATQALGTNLCMRTYASKNIGGTLLGPDTCGPDPILQRYNGTNLAKQQVGSGMGIERVVYVASYLPSNTFGFALNQDFTVYTHLFYNFEPKPDWTFGHDGEPVVPT